MKLLIVNADDFGLSTCINAGVINSHVHGIVTSTSLLTNGKAFEDAVLLSKQYPRLAVGIHFSLVEERPVLPLRDIPTIVDKNGKLCRNADEFFKLLVGGKMRFSEIESELRAQLEKLLEVGIQPTHIDSHQHLHVLPPILNIILNIAEEYGVKWIRNCHDISTLYDNDRKGLRFWGKFAKRKILKRNFSTTDFFFGTNFSGKLIEKDLLEILDCLPNGTSEVMCHPGDEDESLHDKYGHWKFYWKCEQHALISAEIKKRIAEQGIVLTNYREL